MQNVILGVIKGYDFKKVEPFIVSLRNTGYIDSVVLFYSDIDADTLLALEKYNIQLIRFEETFPYIAVDQEILNSFEKQFQFNNLETMPIHTYRFIIWYLYLLQHHNFYTNIILTDVRDVAFQKNPFDFDIGANLCCFIEDRSNTIKTDSFNSTWILNAFGETLLKRIGDYTPSCCGVIIGHNNNILDYLNKMVKLLSEIQAYNYGDDTAAHNCLVFMNKIDNLKLYENESGPVLTLVCKNRETIQFNKKKQVLNGNGDIVNILHQYDRHPDIHEVVYRKNKLALDDKKKLFAYEYFWKIGYEEYYKNKEYGKAKKYFIKGLRITPFDKPMLKTYIREILFRI